ncbi:putative leader peptide [uncultured Friedmanniella sp.]
MKYLHSRIHVDLQRTASASCRRMPCCV